MEEDKLSDVIPSNIVSRQVCVYMAAALSHQTNDRIQQSEGPESEYEEEEEVEEDEINEVQSEDDETKVSSYVVQHAILELADAWYAHFSCH